MHITDDEIVSLNRLVLHKDIPSTRERHEIASSRTSISRMAIGLKFSKEELRERRLLQADMTDGVLLDRYRNIRTKLLARSKNDTGDNFITLVTPVIPYSDSSLVAANLAAVFSLDEAKTSILVEANVNDPKLNDLFYNEKNKGLIEYLESDEVDMSSMILKTGVPRLCFVPSGLSKENSAEYFTSQKMKRFIKELLTRYPDRFPIVNSGSVINSADTRILVALCDVVVLVIPYGMCSDEEVMQAALAIGEDKLAGVVLDGF